MTSPSSPTWRTAALGLLAAVVLPLLGLLCSAAPAEAGLAPANTRAVSTGLGSTGLGSAENQPRAVVQPMAPPTPGPEGPTGPAGPGGRDRGSVNLRVDGLPDKPGSSIVAIVGLTLLSLGPAIMLSCTSFTKILIVLGLTRNALGLQQTPPNQVLAGLALFLSLFIMAPVLDQVVNRGVEPYMDGTKTAAVAFDDGVRPLKKFMLEQTDEKEIALLLNVAKRPQPESANDVGMSTLVPAFILSELKEAFVIGFIIFIPFLVIDMVVSGALMALGMMMMPPVMVSLPFKLLLFVMVDGWALIIKSVVASYG